MAQRTPLYALHAAAGAKLVEFGGWDMPLHYGSQVEEHHAVRRDAGMFDVSHMTRVDLHGPGVRAFLGHLVANNVEKLRVPGRALYTCMLNPDGGVIDDLIIYYLSEDWFRLVVNASTREQDLEWIRQHAPVDVEIRERPDLAMIAVQGPNARMRAWAALGDAVRDASEPLAPFHAALVEDIFLARTGYTGEDGFELIVPNAKAADVWRALQAQGVAPCGLGARDTLRLEAGMNLYGADMDVTTTPLESGLAWTVAWEPEDRNFVGRTALEAQRRLGVPRQLVGLVLLDRGVLRAHQPVITDRGIGEVTSGTFSPTLSRTIALARVPSGIAIGADCRVEIRGRELGARIVKYPFVRNGKSCIDDASN